MIRPVLEYGRWQLRDHLRGAGLVILLFAVVFGLILWRVVGGGAGGAVPPGTLLLMALRPMAWPLVILAVAGIVSTDRVEGYNRALFGSPVAPWFFYLQRFLIGGLIVSLLPVALAAAIGVSLGGWVAPWREVAAVASLYLLLGGVVFFWSTLGRRDWAMGLTLYLGQEALHTARTSGMPLPGWLGHLEALLPPFHLVELGRHTGGGELETVLPAGAGVLHYYGFAAAFIVAALVVLAVRPMGGGGRG